ncbi:MAG: hypothetical protein LBH77_08975 [Tannerella sp.]|jgi:hypothetical protein|nr:hypothetical protein [Tannerella sp.]
MHKKIVLLFLLIISVNGIANAQYWSKEDSIWLKNMLEGEEIKINEETKKAIEDGRLIVPSWMKNAENQLDKIELLKEFEDTKVPDSVKLRRIDPYTMPPAVFALYILYMSEIDSIRESMTCILSKEDREKLEALLPTGTAQALSFRTYNYRPGGTISTDFNHILSMAFSPLYRRKMHNAKHATAYKNYYDEGAIRPVGRLTEHEKRQIRKAARDFKPTNINYPGMKRNGIDD